MSIVSRVIVANGRTVQVLHGLKRIGADLRQPYMRILMFVRRTARENIKKRERTWGRGRPRLGQSLTIKVDNQGGKIGSVLPYAGIQQAGGRIRPKRKYLAIPVSAALRRTGQWPKDFPPKSLKFVPNAPIKIGQHSWVGPALIRAPGFGNGVTRSRGKKSRPRGFKIAAGEVMFALVKSVTIKARPYLVFEQPEQDFAYAELKRHYERVLRRRDGNGPVNTN